MTFYIVTLHIIITRLSTGEYKTNKKLFKGQRIRGDNGIRGDNKR